MCEMLAEMTDRNRPMSYLLTGLLSNLDVIASVPMQDLVDQLPLTREIKDALLQRQGPMSHIVDEVKRYEAGEFQALRYVIPKGHYEPCYRHCNAWASQIHRTISH